MFSGVCWPRAEWRQKTLLLRGSKSGLLSMKKSSLVLGLISCTSSFLLSIAPPEMAVAAYCQGFLELKNPLLTRRFIIFIWNDERNYKICINRISEFGMNTGMIWQIKSSVHAGYSGFFLLFLLGMQPWVVIWVFVGSGGLGVVLQLEMTEHALWRPSDREDRQREPPGHMTGEVNVHAGKEKERRNNLFDRSSRSPSLSSLLPSFSLSQTHTLSLTHSFSAAFFFSMEAMRRKQVWCFLEAQEKRHVSFVFFTLSWLLVVWGDA